MVKKIKVDHQDQVKGGLKIPHSAVPTCSLALTAKLPPLLAFIQSPAYVQEKRKESLHVNIFSEGAHARPQMGLHILSWTYNQNSNWIHLYTHLLPALFNKFAGCNFGWRITCYCFRMKGLYAILTSMYCAHIITLPPRNPLWHSFACTVEPHS